MKPLESSAMQPLSQRVFGSAPVITNMWLICASQSVLFDCYANKRN